MNCNAQFDSINPARGAGARCSFGVLGGPLSPPIPFGPKPYGWSGSARVCSCSVGVSFSPSARRVASMPSPPARCGALPQYHRHHRMRRVTGTPRPPDRHDF
ncbi:hypothetical protein AVEN_270156-1 [Araneus ventricosus]|uniref:Uncharacterized protein n=1 Tax=Araneus ventricosus TaxID=182803 RepID=A0A4Y2XCS4_ARAVE|nr:hypothetical protein AVEN_270156-1 [Araneus ventricosus]